MEFVSHPLIKADTIEKREYQENLASKALKGNTLVVMPTALGKTIVAALVMAEILKEGKKVLFLAPTKPLVNQHSNSLKTIMKIDDEDIAVMTGEVEYGDREDIFKKRIVCATPQTIEHEVAKGRLDLSEIGLLVVDESHRSVKSYAYVDVAQKYMAQAKHPLVLALTASPSAENLKEICETLSIKNIEIRSETDADVLPYVHKKEYENVFVEFPREFEIVRTDLQSVYDDCFAKLKEMHFIHTNIFRKSDLVKLQNDVIRKKIFAAIPYTTTMLKIGYAIEILETQGIFALYNYFEKMKSESTRTNKQIMKDERIQSAFENTKKLYAAGKGHPKLDKLKEIIKMEFEKNPEAKAIVFSHYRESAQVITNVLQEYKAVRFVGQAKTGHDIGMNQARQAKILQDFRDGKYRILVATSVGEEGLDIPSVDMVIFYEPVASEIRKIQREGRTGRKRAGKVFVLITRKTKDETYYWMGHYKEKKMKRVLDDMKEELKAGAGQTKLEL